jgi:PAS domain-containing protein
VQVQYATGTVALPESSIVAPVVFDNQVIGVLAVQSYRADAYDEDDMGLIQDVADRVAVAVADALGPCGQVAGSASTRDALLVIDEEGRLVRLNRAARKLLAADDGSVILGHPVDRPQEDRWPLGTRAFTEQLRPIVDQLKSGHAPTEEIQLILDDRPNHRLKCRASVLLHRGVPVGGVMVLRELKRGRRRGVSADRQQDAEDAASAGAGAIRPYPPAMRLHDAAGDEQP